MTFRLADSQMQRRNSNTKINIFPVDKYEQLCLTENERNALHFIQKIVDSDGIFHNIKLNVAVYLESAEKGYLGVLQYLMDKCPKPSTLESDPIVTWNNKLDLMSFFNLSNSIRNGEVWNWIMCIKAAEKNQTKVINWLNDNGITMKNNIQHLITCENFEIIKVVLNCWTQNSEIKRNVATIFELMQEFGIEWNKQIKAAKVLKWACENDIMSDSK